MRAGISLVIRELSRAVPNVWLNSAEMCPFAQELV